ncbi:hypothetical protein D3C72_2004330 [compost metagenome]
MQFRPMEKGVRPAVLPALSRVDTDTSGSVTVKSVEIEPLPEMTQVCGVILPLKVMLPSAALANCGTATVSAAMAAKSLSFMACG